MDSSQNIQNGIIWVRKGSGNSALFLKTVQMNFGVRPSRGRSGLDNSQNVQNGLIRVRKGSGNSTLFLKTVQIHFGGRSSRGRLGLDSSQNIQNGITQVILDLSMPPYTSVQPHCVQFLPLGARRDSRSAGSIKIRKIVTKMLTRCE